MPIPRPMETVHGELTDRQFQILALVADGFDNSEIALLLAIEVETVKSHLKKAYLRLGARNRAHAVSLAYRTGLLSITSRSRS